ARSVRRHEACRRGRWRCEPNSLLALASTHRQGASKRIITQTGKKVRNELCHRRLTSRCNISQDDPDFVHAPLREPTMTSACPTAQPSANGKRERGSMD